MMTNKLWYEVADAGIELTQGDIILNCPIVRWASTDFNVETQSDIQLLKSLVEAAEIDVVVMTQSCDLENRKVENIILCPHFSLDQYQKDWEETMENLNQNPTKKAWVKYCNDIKNGYVWNLAMLNEGKIGELSLTHRVVDFHEVYTLPRNFLESWLQSKDQSGASQFGH